MHRRSSQATTATPGACNTLKSGLRSWSAASKVPSARLCSNSTAVNEYGHRHTPSGEVGHTCGASIGYIVGRDSWQHDMTYIKTKCVAGNNSRVKHSETNPRNVISLLTLQMMHDECMGHSRDLTSAAPLRRRWPSATATRIRAWAWACAWYHCTCMR